MGDANLKLETACKVLLRRAPLLGCIMQEIHREPSTAVETVGVGFDKHDGKLVMVYSEEFVGKLPVELLTDVVIPHEIAHIVNGHLSRYTNEQTRGIPHALVNIAMDMAINNEDYVCKDGLRSLDAWFKEQFGPQAGSIRASDFGLPDKKSSDFYLAELLKDMPKSPELPPNPGEGGQGGDGGRGNGQEGDQIPGNDPAESTGEAGEDGDTGDAGEDGQACQKPGDREGSTGDPENGGQHPFLEQEDVSRNTKESIARAAVANAHKEWSNNHGKAKGSIAGGVIEKIEGFLFPKKPVAQVFRHLIGSWIGSSWEWSSARINKRSNSYESPGKRLKPRLRLALVIDTSGSMGSKELTLFRGMVKRVQRELDPEIFIMHTDTEVCKSETLRGAKIPVDFHGRGGTSFTPAFTYMRKKGIKPDGVIFFTDGHGDLDPATAKGFRTAWVITPDGTDFPFMYGRGMKVIKLDDCAT